MASAPVITQEMIDLYDDYTHVSLDRRRFIESLTRLAGGSAAAAALLPLLESNAAQAAVVPPGDVRLQATTVEYVSSGGAMSGYYVAPADAPGKLPAVLVIHENRGLTPYNKDVARRLALGGFIALAPDFLGPDGGTPADPDKAREMIRALDPDATLRNAIDSLAYLKHGAATTGKVGAVGFCWGGGLVNRLAVSSPDLDAGVVFYGRAPESAEVPSIKASMLLHFAGLDDRINAGLPDYKAALEGAGIDHTIYVYDNVNHAFHNDTNAARYDQATANLAWDRTMAFLKATLRAGQ